MSTQNKNNTFYLVSMDNCRANDVENVEEVTGTYKGIDISEMSHEEFAILYTKLLIKEGYQQAVNDLKEDEQAVDDFIDYATEWVGVHRMSDDQYDVGLSEESGAFILSKDFVDANGSEVTEEGEEDFNEDLAEYFQAIVENKLSYDTYDCIWKWDATKEALKI